MNKKGFTLIEMLIVIAIISILASVFVVGMGQFRQSAYDSRRIADLRKIQGALEAYARDNSKYPSAASWDELKTALNIYSGGKLPNDPVSVEKYTYCYYSASSEAKDKLKYKMRYILGAKLSDSKHAVLTESYKSTEGTTTDSEFSKYSCTTTSYTCTGANYCLKN